MKGVSKWTECWETECYNWVCRVCLHWEQQTGGQAQTGSRWGEKLATCLMHTFLLHNQTTYTNITSISDNLTHSLTFNISSNGVEAGNLPLWRRVAPEDDVVRVHRYTTVHQVLHDQTWCIYKSCKWVHTPHAQKTSWYVTTGMNRWMYMGASVHVCVCASVTSPSSIHHGRWVNFMESYTPGAQSYCNLWLVKILWMNKTTKPFSYENSIS